MSKIFLDYLLIGLGAGFGAIFRVALSKLLPVSLMNIPLPILLINTVGCFFMGALKSVIDIHPGVTEEVRYFLIPGFLGGFTTFSTFTAEFASLIDMDRYFEAISYAFCSFALSIVFFLVGVKIFR